MEVILENKDLKIRLSSLGAAIRAIEVRLKDGTVRNIVMCFAEESPWKENPFYAGATLAPTAGRIKDGCLPIGSRSYSLTKNENGITHIHGGFHNLSFCQWEIAAWQPEESVTFQAFLPDGAEGYPGNRTFFVTYRLEGSQLHIIQNADTDQPTYINMSNHAYFNLNGFHASGLDQYLKIHAEQVYINDNCHLPKGKIPAAGTEFDFTAFQHLESRINQCKDREQIAISRGYNHCFLLSETDGHSPSYSLMASDQKLSIDFFTDAPALVLYSGGFLDDNYLLSGSGGTSFLSYPGCAVALEPCYPPCYTPCYPPCYPSRCGSNTENPHFVITEHEFHREIKMMFINS